MCLNHPETVPYPKSLEKFSFTKPIPGAKMVGDYCTRRPVPVMQELNGKGVLKTEQWCTLTPL